MHYTSAGNAFNIISGKQVWLRNALLMNDYSEIQHGITCLQTAWRNEAGDKLRGWLDAGWPDFQPAFVSLYDSHIDGIKIGTYMMSLSEHDEDEDELGRLSMWRAYGGDSGVALVLNSHFALSDEDEIKAYTAPVIYKNIPDFVTFFGEWVDGIAANEQLKTLDAETLMGLLFHAFRSFVLCTKHPGFHEEKEWRVFHNPDLDGESKWISSSIEVVNGIPQRIIRLSLFDDLDAGVIGVAPIGLIDRVILGPTAHPIPIGQALTTALFGAGVADANQKIWLSNIPLRR